ncbi:MAG: (Fe-S)-binding protein [Desulfatibacillaceae bacterium]
MKTVSLHIPCMVDLFLPDTARSAIRVLERLGVPWVYREDQTCCGLPAYNAGFSPEAASVAKHMIRVFEQDEAVVSLSGSCMQMMRDHYPALLAGNPEWSRRAKALAAKTREFSQYLVDELGVEEVGAAFDGKVAYHESCRLSRGAGVVEQPKKLIRAVRGAELVPMNKADACCGFGGEFSHAYHEISEEMVADKVNCFLQSGADILVMGEPGCFLNISGYVSRNHPGKKVMLLADLLAGHEKEART